MKNFLLFIFIGFCIHGYSQDTLGISKAHHIRKGFKNINPEFEEHGYKSLAKWMVWDRFIKKSNEENLDTVKFEIAKNDGKWLSQNKTDFSITWVGHSTLLIQLDGLNILTDPHWGDMSSPVSFMGPERVVEPGLEFKNLPKIDIVIISHNHYDHLDSDTIEKLGNGPLYIIPLKLSSFFEDLEITNYQELDWWEEIKFNNVKFICTPSQHYSGRNLFDRDKTLWCSWVIQGSKKVYFAGDSGYFPGFKKIGSKYGPFDVAAIPIGCYMPRWFMKSVNMDPREAVDVYEDLKAEFFIPIHWGTFKLSDEPMKEPPKILMEEVRKRKLNPASFRILKHGETFLPPATVVTDN